MTQFPHNKTSTYVTALSKRIELTEDYEVALVEASFPFTYVHFPQASDSVTLVFSSGTHKTWIVPSRYYTSADDLLYYINMTALTPGFRLKVDPQGYCWVITEDELLKVPAGKGGVLGTLINVVLTPQLAGMLGYATGHIFKYERGAHPINLFVGLPEQMYYYCDLVEEQVVGDKVAPLLRSVNSHAGECTYGSTCSVAFNRPFYVPLVKRHFETIEILIKDALGRNVAFTHGTSTCVLHFRRRQFV